MRYHEHGMCWKKRSACQVSRNGQQVPAPHSSRAVLSQLYAFPFKHSPTLCPPEAFFEFFISHLMFLTFDCYSQYYTCKPPVISYYFYLMNPLRAGLMFALIFSVFSIRLGTLLSTLCVLIN